MVEATRRKFLVMAGAGAASAGAVAIGRGALGEDSSEQPAAADGVAHDSLVVHVKDVRRGQMSIMAGEQEVLLEDRALAARLAAATH